MKKLLSLGGVLVASVALAAEPAALKETAREIPVAAQMDVVVVGGSSAACAAAAEAAKSGAKVFLIAPRPYLGDDLAGRLRLWLEAKGAAQGTPAECIWGDSNFATPAQIKTALSALLAKSKVQVLFGCYPSDIVTGSDGKLAGVVMANRAGRQAILAKVVVDASEHAVVARLAGAKFHPFTPGPVTVRWMAINDEADKGATQKATLTLAVPSKVMDNFGRKATDKKAFWREYVAQLNLPADDFVAWNALEQQARSITGPANPMQSADAPFVIPTAAVVCQQPAGAGTTKCALETFQPVGVERLWVLSACADVARADAEQLLAPVGFMQLGASIGTAAAAQAQKLSAPAGAQVAAQADAAALPADIREPLKGLRPIPPEPLIASVERALPVLGHFDVVVVGGGTAGAPAGIGAARQGAKTLVIEYQHGLGGVGTLGMIDKYWYGNRVGFTMTMPESPLEKRMEWYRQELLKAGAQVWFDALGCGAVVAGNRVTGVVVATPFGRGIVLATQVIDGTGNADVADAAGAKTAFVEDQFAVQMAHRPARSLGSSYMNGNRGAARDADPIQVTKALRDPPEFDPGKNPNAVAKGDAAKPFDLATLLDTRERRHIVGDYTLDWLDVINRRTFPDSITLGTSDYDSHGYQVHPYFMLRPPRPPENSRHQFWGYLPYRCLLPAGLDDLLVIGLGMSLHRDALPILRMQPDLQNSGYAAGVAAAMAVKAGCTARQIDVRALQKHLVSTGILKAEVLKQEDSYPLPTEKIQAAVRGLTNDFIGIEIVMARPDTAIPLLRQAYTDATGAAKLTFAEALGVMGDGTGLPLLLTEAERRATQKDYPVQHDKAGKIIMPDDVVKLLWALAQTHDRRTVPVLCKLADSAGHTQFNRFRPCVIGLGAIGDPAAAPTLAKLIQPALGKPEPSINSLLLACALYRCGDHNGQGEKILRQYTHDLRGHLARHAEAVLKAGKGS
ncbi:MAG: FAD-dependent oxidoreductase [Kiritimatiellaeota bacterium]|nr:FAD-dependent oxidoreductase [Kiritimatiellota bacterium]